jgi:hypothetical protein
MARYGKLMEFYHKYSHGEQQFGHLKIVFLVSEEY